MQVLKQPIMSSEEARQFLAELKAAYQSLPATDRVAVRTALEQVSEASSPAVDGDYYVSPEFSQPETERILAERDRVMRLDRLEIFEEFRSGRCSDQVYQLLSLRYPKAVLLNLAGSNQWSRRNVEHWADEIPYVGYDANF